MSTLPCYIAASIAYRSSLIAHELILPSLSSYLAKFAVAAKIREKGWISEFELSPSVPFQTGETNYAGWPERNATRLIFDLSVSHCTHCTMHTVPAYTMAPKASNM